MSRWQPQCRRVSLSSVRFVPLAWFISWAPSRCQRGVLWGRGFFITADKHTAGCPLPSWGTQQSPAHPSATGPVGIHSSTSGKAAQCSKTETRCTFCLPTSLIKKQRKTLISCSINTASPSSLPDTYPAQWDLICKYEALALLHLSWNISVFLSNLSKAEDSLTILYGLLALCCPHGAEGERFGLVLLPHQPAHSNRKLCPGLKNMLF